MSRTVGCYVVELLVANGIDTVFGIPGVHNLELYRGLAAAIARPAPSVPNAGALARRPLRHVLMRHEQGAGFAADGYARLSGRPAAAFTISGPGVTNILTAVGQAYSDSVPLLVIASAPASATLGADCGVLHELRDQRALAAGVFGAACSAGSAEEVRDQLRRCFAALRGGRPRPAYLEIPLDVLEAPTSLDIERFAPPEVPVAATAAIAAAAALLEQAVRPIVIAGGGARNAGAALGGLLDTLDCPLVTTVAGKGAVAESDRKNLGAALPYPAVQSLIAAADVVLAVGTELAETDLYSAAKLPMRGALIRIDLDPGKLADRYAAAVPVLGEAAATLRSIGARLTARRGWCTQTGGGGWRAQLERSFEPGARAALRALAALRAALPADGVVFSDMTQIAYLGNYAFAVEGPGRWFHPCGFGTLGYALPAAVGAKLACPHRPVVALAGDFGVQFTLNELMTAVEARIALPIVVWNNAALGQIRDDMQTAGIPLTGVIGRNPDFVALAAAYGADGVRVAAPDDLAAALGTALARAGPTLIEVAAGG